MDDKYLDNRPKAETTTVEDLVDAVNNGEIRIPSFQRRLAWDAEDVLALFDSIYKGYPVGSLLMQEALAKAERLNIGPLYIEAPEVTAARWVVDGQQRLVSLTAGLSRPGPIPQTPDDPYVVYFDARNRAFRTPPNNGKVPSTWIPATKLLDGAELSEWIFEWEHQDERELRTAAFEAGKRIRQYRIPQYIVTTDDKDVLREIFYRINKSGKSLEWTEVHDALYGHKREAPSTLEELADDLAVLGMGRPRERTLLSCVVAYEGLDVTQNLGTHTQKHASILQEGAAEALPALRRVFSFLREHASIPHLRLLPRSTPLIVLTRFFGLYPDPEPRNVTLLVRWVWRFLAGALDVSEPTLKRRGVMNIETDNESAAVQTLLALVCNQPESGYTLPESFDARSAASRLALLGMKHLQPHDLQQEEQIDIAECIRKNGRKAFRKIWAQGASSPANRILLPGTGPAFRELDAFMEETYSFTVLESHGIGEEAARAFQKGDCNVFIQHREKTIEEATRTLIKRFAAWGRNDRPSIQALLTHQHAAV